MRVPALFLMLVLCGCSSGGGGALDCALLSGDNCWKSTLARICACAPGASDAGSVSSGTLSADGLSCSYADGTEVIFDAQLSLPLSSSQSIDLTLKSGGKTCFTYSQKESSYVVSVDGDTARFEGIPPDQAVLTCPDGSTYRGGYKALLGCESNYKKLSQMLPGLVVQGSGSDSGGLELTGAGAGGPVTLFYCSR